MISLFGYLFIHLTIYYIYWTHFISKERCAHWMHLNECIH